MAQVHTILHRARQVGDHAPDFRLIDHLGEPVQLEQLRRQGPVVLSFYRGSWCEHCVNELLALRQVAPVLSGLGASLVGISPEVPRQSRTTRRTLELPFHVLSDLSNVVARRFGLVYQLSQELLTTYQKFGVDLVEHNGGRPSWVVRNGRP